MSSAYTGVLVLSSAAQSKRMPLSSCHIKEEVAAAGRQCKQQGYISGVTNQQPGSAGTLSVSVLEETGSPAGKLKTVTLPQSMCLSSTA
jgi:hypothetical protein